MDNKSIIAAILIILAWTSLTMDAVYGDGSSALNYSAANNTTLGNISIQDESSKNPAFMIGGDRQVRLMNDSRVSPSATLSTIQSGHSHRTLPRKPVKDTCKMWNTIEGVPHGHVTYYN